MATDWSFCLVAAINVVNVPTLETLTIVGKGIEMPNISEHANSTATSFHETVRARAIDDAEFRISLLETAAEAIVSGDLEDGKAALRLYVKSTTGYEPVATELGVHPKSLVRMLGSGGNPRASNLIALLTRSLRRENIRINVKATSRLEGRSAVTASG